MAKTVTIGGTTYQLPLNNQNPAWGEEMTDIIDALITQVNNLQGPNDIVESSATILNTSGAKEITPFTFDSVNVRSFEATYNVSRAMTKDITSYSGDGATTTVVVSGNHDIFTGDTITISGTGDIDGTFAITRVDDTTFTISSAFNGASTGGQFNIELVESGVILGNYGLQGWHISRFRNGNARIDFDITTSGTITYTPDVLTVATGTHTGLIKYLAKTVLNS